MDAYFCERKPVALNIMPKSVCSQSYLSDLTSLGEVNGLTSIIYALLTASFVGAGFGYIFAPTQVRTSAAASKVHVENRERSTLRCP